MCQGIFGGEGNKAILCLHERGDRSGAVCLSVFARRGGGSVSQDNCKQALEEYCSTRLIKECSSVCAGINSNQFYLFVDSRFVSRPVSNTQNIG